MVSENGHHLDQVTIGPTCGTCAHRLGRDELATCRACVADTRANLDAILNSYALLPDLLDALGSNAPSRNARGAGERPMPGGDPLVMLGPGSSADARRRAAHAGHDPDWDQDDRPDDPPSVAHELARWEDDWRRARREPAAPGPASVHSATAYLRRNITWAASRHDAFPDFAQDLTHLRGRLESTTGTSTRPQRAAVPCLDCAGQLERAWTHRGLDDEWTCRHCHREYSAPAYLLAVRATLEAVTGE